MHIYESWVVRPFLQVGGIVSADFIEPVACALTQAGHGDVLIQKRSHYVPTP